MRAGWAIFAAGLLGVGGCAGPGAPPGCPTTFVIDVSPAAGTASHMSAAPDNQVVFTDTGNSAAPGQPSGAGCALNNLISSVMWKSSDTVNVQLVISPTPSGGTTVTATCLGETEGAATITASQYAGGLTGTGTATLTCQ